MCRYRQRRKLATAAPAVVETLVGARQGSRWKWAAGAGGQSSYRFGRRTGRGRGGARWIGSDDERGGEGPGEGTHGQRALRQRRTVCVCVCVCWGRGGQAARQAAKRWPRGFWSPQRPRFRRGSGLGRPGGCSERRVRTEMLGPQTTWHAGHGHGLIYHPCASCPLARQRVKIAKGPNSRRGHGGQLLPAPDIRYLDTFRTAPCIHARRFTAATSSPPPRVQMPPHLGLPAIARIQHGASDADWEGVYEVIAATASCEQHEKIAMLAPTGVGAAAKASAS